MGRILIIGLDGASPALVRRWQDHLPHLRRLMETGTAGVLQSVIPPRSIPAWYCFATGMNPARLGVFGFSQRLPDTYDYTFANLSFCRAPTFWQRLNDHGLKTAVVHVPGTFPPHPVGGALVSGWPAPTNLGTLTYTHPPELSRELDSLLNRPFEFLSDLPMRTDNDADVLADRLRILKMHGDVAHHVLSTREWDVGLVVFSPIDRASHQFWRHLDPEHPAHDPNFRDALRNVYQAADAQVSRLLDLLNEDDTVFIVSDHGFGPAARTFYLNEWLRRNEYLVLEKNHSENTVSLRSAVIGTLARPLFWLNDVSPLFRRLAAPLKKRAISNALRRDYVQTTKQGLVRLNHLPVDWSKTRAYCPDEASLYLNLRGRDPQGIVTPGTEADDLLREIAAGLHAVPDPTTGEPVDVHVHRKEEIYSGPYLADAPEAIIEMDSYATEVMAELGSDELLRPNTARNGTHTLDGLFIANGPDIDAGATRDAHLFDLAPTVLHMSNIPVPTTIDGRVLQSIFKESSPIHTRAVRTASDDTDVDERATVLSDDEQAQVEKQLRDLGYLN